MPRTSALQCLLGLWLLGLSEGEKAQDVQRQTGVDMKFLRHIADTQPRSALNLSPGAAHQAQNRANQGGLAGAIGANQGDNFTGMDGHIHRVYQGTASADYRERSCTD